ncbi:hypothetical protein MTO96_034655 [Rhipicephalus appendiculatus]
MPALPRNDFKIVVRPKGGLNIAAIGAVRIASAVYRDAGVSDQDASEDIVCPNTQQNIVVISTPCSTNAEKYRKLEAIGIGNRQYEVNAYETAPDHTVKGVIRGIPLEEDAWTINTKIVNAKNPTALVVQASQQHYDSHHRLRKPKSAHPRQVWRHSASLLVVQEAGRHLSPVR